MTYSNPDYLVSTEWLAEHINDANLRIVDVTAMLTSKLINRAEAEFFNKGHIPGAVFFDVPAGHGVLSDPDAPLPWTWPSKQQFEATMESVGIANDSRVVIVARTPREGLDSGTMWCTRAWWTMHHFGVDCAILNGGVEKWEAEGRAMVTERKAPAASQFTASDDYARGCADKSDVLASRGETETCLVDALSASSFNGDDDGYGPRRGHIAGAVNVPFRSLINGESADFLEPDAMRNAVAGMIDQPRVITYCGGAIAATVNAFALKLCGHEDVKVYDASLMEWSADETLPMETGSG
mgnify:FL=1